jgi:hypothetical protein
MTLGSMAPFGRIQCYSEVLSEDATTLWDQFYQHFWCQYRAGFGQKIFDAFLVTFCGKIEPKYGARHKGCKPKTCSKISAQMLVKQDSTFCAIYLMLAQLRIAQIGW